MGKALTPEQLAADGDVKLLLKEIMPVTQAGLEQREGFRPLGAFVALDGTVSRLDSDAGAETPTKAAVDLLGERLKRQVEAGVIRSAAVAADVLIWRREDGEEASNAVSVHVEHQSGYCVDLLIPYKVRKGLMSRLRSKPQVMFRKMVAQESQPQFWAAA